MTADTERRERWSAALDPVEFFIAEDGHRSMALRETDELVTAAMAVADAERAEAEVTITALRTEITALRRDIDERHVPAEIYENARQQWQDEIATNDALRAQLAEARRRTLNSASGYIYGRAVYYGLTGRNLKIVSQIADDLRNRGDVP